MARLAASKVRALVIGGSGILGAALRRELQAAGVACAGTSSSPGSSDLLHLDVRDRLHVTAFFEAHAFEVVVNAAATGVTRGSASPRALIEVNEQGAGTIAEVLSGLVRPPRLVHLASATEPRGPGDAESPYARSKANGCARVREVAKRRTSPVTIARLHNVYSGQRVPGRFLSDALDAALQGRELVLEFADRVRDFCLLDDVARCLAGLVVGEPPVEEVEIGTAAGTSIRDAARAVYRATGRSPELVRAAAIARFDPHPVEIADPEGPGFLRCTTLLPEGLQQVLRRRT